MAFQITVESHDGTDVEPRRRLKGSDPHQPKHGNLRSPYTSPEVTPATSRQGTGITVSVSGDESASPFPSSELPEPPTRTDSLQNHKRRLSQTDNEPADARPKLPTSLFPVNAQPNSSFVEYDDQQPHSPGGPSIERVDSLQVARGRIVAQLTAPGPAYGRGHVPERTTSLQSNQSNVSNVSRASSTQYSETSVPVPLNSRFQNSIPLAHERVRHARESAFRFPVWVRSIGLSPADERAFAAAVGPEDPSEQDMRILNMTTLRYLGIEPLQGNRILRAVQIYFEDTDAAASKKSNEDTLVVAQSNSRMCNVEDGCAIS